MFAPATIVHMATGLLQRLLHPQAETRGARSVEESLLSFALGGTRSGMHVTQSSALSATAVWACVRILAESVAQLPLPLYERTETGKKRATGHPVYGLLHSLPNPEMTSFQLRRLMMVHLSTWGNAYCEIEWSNDGYPVALWPLVPSNTDPVRIDGQLMYAVRLPDGQTKALPSYRVWHVTGLGSDPLVGISPIRQHMETIGLAQAMTAHGATFFANGARPGLVLKHPGTLNADALQRLKESITAAYEGLDNAYRTMILEEGMGIEKLTIPPDEAQFLGSREFQTVEIARIFNVPPHMIQHLADATYSNIEHQGLQFVTNTLMPYLVNFEQTASRDLLVGEERDRYYAEHLVDGLQRGDIKTRFEAYNAAIQTGILTINEARSKENLDRVDGGDVHLVPLNLAPLGANGPQISPKTPQDGARSVASACECGNKAHKALRDAQTPSEPASVPADALHKRRAATAQALVPVFADALGRIVRRETKAVSKAAAKYLGSRALADFDQWLDTFYEEFTAQFERDLTPAMLAVARQAAQACADELGGDALPVGDEMRAFIAEFLRNMALDHAGASKYQLRAALQDSEEPTQAVETELAQWEETRAGTAGDMTAFEALNALLIFGYGQRQIRRLMWAASGSSCRFCQSLSGQTIDIESFFVGEGTEIDMGADGTMRISRNKRHGPLHRGCDCTVQAVIEAA